MSDYYRNGMDAIVLAGDAPLAPRNGKIEFVDLEARQQAIHNIASLSGAIIGALLWRRHWIIAALLGSALGYHGATLITGRE